MANEPIDNDYSLSRVPEGAKQPLWQILMIRIGAICCVSQLVLGATLGYGMTFWGAFWATMLGSVILQVVHYKRTKKRLFLMAPLHHHFEKKGWSETKVVIRFWIVSGALAGFGFVLFFIQPIVMGMVA